MHKANSVNDYRNQFLGYTDTIKLHGRTAADTVAALRHLFPKRRRTGSILAGGAISADLPLAGISAANENKGQTSCSRGYGNFVGTRPLRKFSIGGFALIYGVTAAHVLAVGIQHIIACGPKREAKLVVAFETTYRLPAKTGRQLCKHLR